MTAVTALIREQKTTNELLRQLMAELQQQRR
jgi:hypothetical protein